MEFLIKAYKSNEFQNNYSEYFMSSLKDQLNFSIILMIVIFHMKLI